MWLGSSVGFAATGCAQGPIPGRMSLPREVAPGRFYLITRRCTQRTFLLRPDRATNQAVLYCMALAAQRARIEVVLPCVLSNHHHAVVYDRYGTYPAFIEHFHKLVARSQNALRGRWENFWSSEQTCVVRLVGADDVMNKLVYVATNPVKDHLVDRVDHWPGVNGLGALLGRRPIVVNRPRHFFRSNGKLPAAVTLTFEIPPELGDADAVLATLNARVKAVEAETAAERSRTGRRVLGRPRGTAPGVAHDRSTSREPRRNLRPTVAARSVWARIEALQRNRDFVAAYRAARALWVSGQEAWFPAGTYWLRRFANIRVAA